jgi:pimeloyl-ACP methyl ester carboxylesterase
VFHLSPFFDKITDNQRQGRLVFDIYRKETSKMKMLTTLATAVLMTCGAFAATPLQDKIAKSYQIKKLDKWCGYDRAVIDFKGYEAWVVEPKISAAYGKPWTWTMQWATAFPDRTGAPDMLARGWHHATIITFQHRMDEKGIAVSRDFQKYLVDELGFNEKASLIGMSWGGFFSIRYSNAHPECIRSIYLDAPLLNFSKFGKAVSKEEALKRLGPWGKNPPADGNWNTDPRMPVNMASSIAKAKLPVLLIYGGADKVVEPDENCELFLKRFKEAGGDIIVNRRALFGHHPHGLDPTKTSQIYDFFLKHAPVAPKKADSKN